MTLLKVSKDLTCIFNNNVDPVYKILSYKKLVTVYKRYDVRQSPPLPSKFCMGWPCILVNIFDDGFSRVWVHQKCIQIKTEELLSDSTLMFVGPNSYEYANMVRYMLNKVVNAR